LTSALEQLSQRFDVVVFDTPPLLAVSDGLPIAQQVAGVVVVAQVDRTPVRALQRGVRILKDAGANILGPVATQVPAEAPSRSEASSPRPPGRARLTLPVVGAGEPGARR
jgi:Mrp family chromosome partitioning ATPase